MYENLLRPHEVSQVPTLQHISTVSLKLKQSEKRREEKRIRQIAASRSRTVEKRKREAVENGDDEEYGDTGAEVDDDADSKEKDTKRVKTDNEPADVLANSSVQAQPPSSTPAQGDADVKMDSPMPVPITLLEADTTEPTTQLLAKVMSEVRGHTSYLTFAVLLPAVVERVQATTETPKNGVTATATPETEKQIAAPAPAGDDTPVSCSVVKLLYGFRSCRHRV